MGHPIHKHMTGQRYDAKKAYDKDLTDSARLHYLENSEHDKSVSRKSSSPLDARPTVKPVEKPEEVATKITDENKYIPELDHGAVSRKSSSPAKHTEGVRGHTHGSHGRTKPDYSDYEAQEARKKGTPPPQKKQ